METIHIGDDRIKIMLSREDLARYDLGDRPLDPDSEAVSAALRRLLLDAGFEDGKGRLYIQLYESKTGGCELFVTRLPAEALEDEKDIEAAPVYVSFSCLNDAVQLARRLKGTAGFPPADLLHDGVSWYLGFDEEPPAVVRDYGDTMNGAVTAYITEYAKAVRKGDALTHLVKL